MTTQLERVMENSVSVQEAIDTLEVEQKTVQDFLAPLKDWEPAVDNHGQFVLRNKRSQNDFVPTDHALDLLCRILPGGISTWAVKALRDPYTHATKRDSDGEPVVLWERDYRDMAVLRDYIRVNLFQNDRIDMDKPRLWRTWEDGTLRAVLSNQYARVNNRWYLQLLQSMLPEEACVVRSSGNADTLYMDIFLGEDSVVNTDDGGLGGMLHVGNSEIGERRVVLTPSILRMICTNGALGWSKLGEEIKTVHRRKDGKIDLDILQKKIVEVYQTIVPSFETGIERFLGIKAYGVGDVPMPKVFAQLAIDYSFSKRQVRNIWQEWGVEMGILGASDAKTAYGLQNAITRYSNRLDGKGMVQFDLAGGNMITHTQSSWNRFLGRANNLDDKEIVKRIGDLTMAS